MIPKILPGLTGADPPLSKCFGRKARCTGHRKQPYRYNFGWRFQRGKRGKPNVPEIAAFATFINKKNRK